ncbi:hypothetical protein ARAM_005577 [Aspergillus rambellii]|uniref:NADP-dependent oxidoreductase domain-containing protein n=1 Tax=Aspergillus rambellii TaxID=308745 RepID=A0A0F8U570_9EURO|nr:hypothetical protein ARAM_005577 [Aspergillus rambellii]
MIPSHTDLLSTLLANTSLEKLDEYNHLGSHGSNTNSNNVHGAIDDSNSNNSTVTAKDNAVESGKDPVDDPVGFMNSLFESLRKKFREVLDDGDEVLFWTEQSNPTEATDVNMPSLVGREVGETGYGLMGTFHRWNNVFECLEKALELGGNFWNGGELYGTPERRSVDECLRVLDGTKTIDIFECARQDPTTTVEHTVTVLAQLVKEGKIGGIGLSEVHAETIRRANKIHPIAAVEVELSLWDTSILTNGVAETCAELGIPVVAYSPLGRGILAGAFTKNVKLLNEVNDLAARKGLTPVQVALAWILTLSGKPGMPTIIPIPGGTTTDKVTQNLQGVPHLSDADMAEIDAILEQNKITGARY